MKLARNSATTNSVLAVLYGGTKLTYYQQLKRNAETTTPRLVLQYTTDLTLVTIHAWSASVARQPASLQKHTKLEDRSITRHIIAPIMHQRTSGPPPGTRHRR